MQWKEMDIVLHTLKLNWDCEIFHLTVAYGKAIVREPPPHWAALKIIFLGTIQQKTFYCKWRGLTYKCPLCVL